MIFSAPVKVKCLITVEPRFNPGPRQGQPNSNKIANTRFRYIEVLSHTFYYNWGKKNISFYRGLHYIEVRSIKVLLCHENNTNGR